MKPLITYLYTGRSAVFENGVCEVSVHQGAEFPDHKVFKSPEIWIVSSGNPIDDSKLSEFIDALESAKALLEEWRKDTGVEIDSVAEIRENRKTPNLRTH